jgi:hypothetical protein
VALALAALVGGALLVGAGRESRPLLQVAPTAVPTLVPDVPNPSLPIIVVPAGLAPRMTPDEVSQEVVGLIETSHVGLPSVPISVTKITLVPPGGTYAVSGPDMQDHGSVTEHGLYWVVEALGTSVVCSSFCDEWSGLAYVMDDATGELLGSAGAVAPGGLGVPSDSFRRILADNGLLFVPAHAPATGVVDSRQIVDHLDPRLFRGGMNANGPVFGTVVMENPAMKRSGRVWWPGPGASRQIWWVGSMDQTPAGDDLIWVV